MSNLRVLTGFLRQQSQNRHEVAELRSKDHAPNNQLIARFREESKMFREAAEIVERQPQGVTMTSEQSDRLEAKITAATLPSEPVKGMSVNGKKIGRPPKMTLKEIQNAAQGPAQKIAEKDATPESLLAHATATPEKVAAPPEYA